MPISLLPYVPALIIPIGITIYFVKNSASTLRTIINAANISMLVVLVYFVLLGQYFQNYYMGPPLTPYPSLVISEYWMGLLIFVVLPLNALYFFTRYMKWRSHKDKQGRAHNQ